MSCSHPSVAQSFDRIRGTVTCTLCGEVLNDQQFELDPAFARGDKPPSRPPPGFARPMRQTMLSNPGTHRPSVENARRNMTAISRQLEISPDDVEKAVAIFKQAVGNNAIGGSRPSILCACLYAVCRRANTPHSIFDFADATKESPYAILSHLKVICRATCTQLPPPDPTFYVHRLAQLLDLGPRTEEISILSIKILRAMNAEWLGYGRRPLGLCGAAVLVAANAFGVRRSVEDVVGFVRLSADTILLRMSEFLRTSASSLADIDEYQPSTTSLPPALARASGHDWIQESSMRHLAQLYYSLLNEAKQSAPPTEERKARWEEFIRLHCRANNIDVSVDSLDLTNLSATDQLAILGASEVAPVSAEEVRDVTEIESTRLIVSATAAALGVEAPPPIRSPSQNGSVAREDGFGLNLTQNDVGGMDGMWIGMGGSSGYGGGAATSSDNMFGNDGGFEEEDEFAFGGGGGGSSFDNNQTWSQAGKSEAFSQNSNLKSEGLSQYGVKSEKFDGVNTQVATVQSMLKRFDQLKQLNSDITTHVTNVVQKAHFEILVLPSIETDLGIKRDNSVIVFDTTVDDDDSDGVQDPFSSAKTTLNPSVKVKVKEEPQSQNIPTTFAVTSQPAETNKLSEDLRMYIIQDLEVRIRLEAAGKKVFGDKWDAGYARGDDEVLQAEIRACLANGEEQVDGEGRAINARSRKKTKIRKHATAAAAIKESLRNKGAGQIDTNAIFGDEEGPQAMDIQEVSEGDDDNTAMWDD